MGERVVSTLVTMENVFAATQCRTEQRQQLWSTWEARRVYKQINVNREKSARVLGYNNSAPHRQRVFRHVRESESDWEIRQRRECVQESYSFRRKIMNEIQRLLVHFPHHFHSVECATGSCADVFWFWWQIRCVDKFIRFQTGLISKFDPTDTDPTDGLHFIICALCKSSGHCVEIN